MSIIERILDIIIPHECLGCRKEGSLLCESCSSVLTQLPPRCYLCKRWENGSHTCQRCRKKSSLLAVYKATSYDDQTAKELIKVLKFGRARGAAKSMARTMSVGLEIPENSCITFVPTANSRVRLRGYDQAALIARELSRRLGVPCATLLVRIGSQRQTGRDREARIHQMDNAFRVINPAAIKGKNVLVVDDVLTTGATCEAAARLLKESGARSVAAAVFAVA